MKKITRDRIRAFLARHATNELVLDIGSGGANLDAYFPRRMTFDIDPERNPQILGDIHAMPFPDNSYDVIVCSEVLEHLHSPYKAIAEIERVLRPGGKLILTTRFIFPIHDAPYDYFRFTQAGLSALLNGWHIVDEEVETKTFETIAVLLQRIIFQTKLRGGKITKGFLYILMRLFLTLDWLVCDMYGDIRRKEHISSLLTSGVYIVATKPKES